jgi:hypothetical protein
MDYVSYESIEQVDVLTGFSVRWERRPHRVKVLGLEIGPDLPEVEVVGGAWANGERASDVARVDVGVGSIEGRSAQAGTTTIELRGQRKLAATGDAELRIPLDQPAAAAFLTGFRFEVGPDHRNGFTLHALEVRLGAPVIDHGVARVPVHAELDGGPVPDRVQRLGHAHASTVDVSWVVVGCAADEVARDSASGEIKRWPSLRGASARSELAVDLDLPQPALVGLSGFRVDVDGGPLDGRYTRGMTVWTEPVDGATRVRLGFDNAGTLARPLHVDLGADLTALRLPEAADLWSVSLTP